MIIAHRRPVPAGRAEADDLAVPTELVELDPDTGRIEVIAPAVSGRSKARPFDDPATGRLAWYEGPAGFSTDANADQAVLVVEGVGAQPRPSAVVGRSWLGATTETWSAIGHGEWFPDGRIVQAVQVQTRITWWPFPLSSTWRCVAVAPGEPGAVVASADGQAEPSWHPIAGLVTARVDGRTVTIPRLGVTFDVPATQAFDPYVSPDGTRVAVLTRGPRWGLWIQDLTTKTGRWLIDPTNTTVECSHATWDGNDAILCSMKVYGGPVEDRTSAWYRSLYRLPLAGGGQRLTRAADGSVEQARRRSTAT